MIDLSFYLPELILLISLSFIILFDLFLPNGKKEIWKDITARECLTKYENMDPHGNELKLREIEGKELQLLNVMENNK